MLGGDLQIVGSALTAGGASLRIVGVLPPGFSGTGRGLLVDLFVPPQTFFGSLGYKDRLDQHLADFDVAARLRPGIKVEQAQLEEDATLRQLQSDGLEPAPGRTAAVFPFADFQIGLAAKLMAPLFLVLLVAAANLANLRLVDNEARRRETGIRLALGAGRGHLLRQHASETLLLCGLGTALGLVLAGWLIDLAPAILYAGESHTDFRVRLDGRTFAFSAAALHQARAACSTLPGSPVEVACRVADHTGVGVLALRRAGVEIVEHGFRRCRRLRPSHPRSGQPACTGQDHQHSF